MKPITLSEAGELTGSTFRTVRKRAQAAGLVPIQSTGKSDLYDSVALLRAVLAPEPDASGELDPIQERARRDREAADKLALENAVARGDLVRLSVWQDELAAFLGEIRAQLLAMPSRMAPQLVGKSLGEVGDRIGADVHDVLDRLSHYKPGAKKR